MLLFAALAISGYEMVHSYVPKRAPPPIAATEDPHRMVDLISRADLPAVMPAAFDREKYTSPTTKTLFTLNSQIAGEKFTIAADYS